MAGTGGGWNSFMQGREGRVMLYGICAALCAYNAVLPVFELLFAPGQSAALVASIGEGGFYALTALRVVVCLWAAVAFARQAMKAFAEGDDN